MVGGLQMTLVFCSTSGLGVAAREGWEGPLADKNRLGQDKRWNGHSTGTRCTASRLDSCTWCTLAAGGSVRLCM
jgi:hypothetical protein